jgi:hypothetical protein
MENEFTGQHGITATVNDSVELLELLDTGKLVDLIRKEVNKHVTQQLPKIRISNATILWHEVIWKMELQLKLLKEILVYETWHP